MSDDPGSVAASYFKAWQAHDFTGLRALLADDVTFDGPLAHLGNADDCVKGLEGMTKIMQKVDVKKTFVDGDDVITWFELHTSVADPVPTANWSHVEGGKITAIKVAFDARDLAPPDRK
jgi:ketosteroid isomerase-like protein